MLGWLGSNSPCRAVWAGRLSSPCLRIDWRSRTDVEAAVAGRFQAVGAVLPDQAQDAEAGAVALFGVRPALQDQLGKLGGAGTDRRRFAADPLDRPLGVAAMRTRHMFGERRMPAAAGGAQMHGDALTFAEQLDGVGGDARVELLTDQPMRHRVVMAVDVDMVVEPNPAQTPLGIFVGLRRQGLQRRAVELEEQIAAADTQAPHRTGIKIGDQLADRLVQLGEREEAAIAQPCQNPALDHQHADLDLRLVARAPRPCRQDRGAVMGRQIEIGAVETRLVPVGAGDPDLRVIGDQLRRHAAHEGERADMRADPVGQGLRPARLGIGVAGGAHHRDKDLGLPDLASAPVVQLDGLPGIIDKHALAGRMRLPHGRRQPALPGAVQLAPAAVAVAVGFGLPIFLPQQHQGDAGPAQLVVDMGPIRLGPATRSLGTAGAGVKHRLQHRVA